MRILAILALTAALGACGVIAPGVPVVTPYDKQFDGRFGGDPRVDAMSAADRGRALAEEGTFDDVTRP